MSNEIGLNPTSKSIKSRIKSNNIVRLNPSPNENTLPNFSNDIRLNRLARSSNLLKVATFFARHKASTFRILSRELKIPRSSLFWAIEELINLGFIEPVDEIRQRKGRPAFIYATPDASEEDIKRARIRHRRISNPKYKAAERLAQTLLTEYLEKRERCEISIREILIFVREVKLPYSSVDVAEIVAELLSEKGIKIWR